MREFLEISISAYLYSVLHISCRIFLWNPVIGVAKFHVRKPCFLQFCWVVLLLGRFTCLKSKLMLSKVIFNFLPNYIVVVLFQPRANGMGITSCPESVLMVALKKLTKLDFLDGWNFSRRSVNDMLSRGINWKFIFCQCAVKKYWASQNCSKY